MKHVTRQDWRLAAFAASAFIFLVTHQPARGECLSPSTSGGATATTVYRCPENDPSSAKQPILVNPEKSTVVERGSSEVPWFEPKPEEKKIEASATPGREGDVAKPVTDDLEAVKGPETIIKAANAPDAEETVKVKKKVTSKKKLASKKRMKTKNARAKATKVKPAAETAKIESKPPDDKTIVWTRKDMSLGNRIVNWLGL